MTIANNNGMIDTFSSDEDDEDCPSDTSTVQHDEEHRPKRTHTHEDLIRFIKISTAMQMSISNISSNTDSDADSELQSTRYIHSHVQLFSQLSCIFLHPVNTSGISDQVSQHTGRGQGGRGRGVADQPQKLAV